jgi:UDP-N-acetylglucosamine--N-acetylmuramyl-(pentapeptide) pyrophosphoryl-undecaprenol N-acetylglucosamine transferase
MFMLEIKTKKYVIMAGGTGGHVIPGIAVAKELTRQGHQVSWIGTASGIEAKLVPEQQIAFYSIDIKSLRGKGLARKLLIPILLLKAIWQAGRILFKLKPNGVISMGGFVAGPGGIAAWVLGIDLYVHEQNAVAGLTNRCLAKFAKKVFVACSPTQKLNISAHKIIETGNPVRSEIMAIPAPDRRNIGKHGRLRILVLGGSLGAKAINQVLPQALVLLPDDKKPEVWHQSGAVHFEETQQYYLDNKIKVNLVAYIDDMSKAYEFADIVICRAGALTISELAAVGIASILIPFPHAVDDHQTKNAHILTRVGAAVLVSQPNLTPAHLADLIVKYTDHPEICLEMARCARSLAKTNATVQMVAACQ